MMDVAVKPQTFAGGVLQAPSSKSQSQRALLMAAMASGRSVVSNVLTSPDTDAMRKACTSIGATFRSDGPGRWQIDGVAGRPKMLDKTIDVGGSGQVLRFFSAMALIQPNRFRIQGDRSVHNLRCMKDFTTGISALGGGYCYLAKPGYAPIEFSGQLVSGHAVVEGGDSQVVSALLLASAHIEGVTTIQVTKPGELPWVTLTQSWLPGSVKMIPQQKQHRYMVVGSREKPAFTYEVPGDFSSIAYIVVAAGLVGAELTVQGLSWSDLQGDKRCIDIVQLMDQAGALERCPDGIQVRGKMRLVSNRTIDVNDCIDMITIVAVVACYAEGETTITGAAVSRQKESDRLFTMVSELRKMGARITMHDDGLHIVGGPLQGADVESWQDHRVAMALTVAALAATGPSVVRGVHCVAKSYARFFHDLQQIGASVERV